MTDFMGSQVQEKLSSNYLSYINENWNVFPDQQTRNKYIKRIVILGSESTGKTTLCSRLARYYQTVWTKEYGRILCERKLSNSLSSTAASSLLPVPSYEWNDEDFKEIFIQQNLSELHATRYLSDRRNKFLICDTNSFVSGIWYERYMTHPVPQDLNEIHESMCINPVIYLLSDIEGMPFVQDGFRDGEEIRENMHKQFLHALQKEKEKNNIPYQVLTGSYDERFYQAIQIIDSLIS
jgi:HTH-type transcriptional repressor of NAD biosynthesis genes